VTSYIEYSISSSVALSHPLPNMWMNRSVNTNAETNLSSVVSTFQTGGVDEDRCMRRGRLQLGRVIEGRDHRLFRHGPRYGQVDWIGNLGRCGGRLHLERRGEDPVVWNGSTAVVVVVILGLPRSDHVRQYCRQAFPTLPVVFISNT